MNLPDYHLHTPYCGHAHGKIAEYIESAIDKGLRVICFTDHLYRYYLSRSQRRRYWDWGMNATRLEKYVSEVTDLKTVYSKDIEIHLGLEIDYIEGAEDLLYPIIQDYNFDFLLGSIHCIPSVGWKHISKYTEEEPLDKFSKYFQAIEKAIESGLFDSIAHPDFIWRYAKWPLDSNLQVFKMIDSIAQKATERNVCLEINSNAYLWSRMYHIPGGDPFNVLLDSIRDNSTKITIGSDAHQPSAVARSFNDISNLLKAHAILNTNIFINRESSPIAIN